MIGLDRFDEVILRDESRKNQISEIKVVRPRFEPRTPCNVAPNKHMQEKKTNQKNYGYR